MRCSSRHAPAVSPASSASCRFEPRDDARLEQRSNQRVALLARTRPRRDDVPVFCGDGLTSPMSCSRCGGDELRDSGSAYRVGVGH